MFHYLTKKTLPELMPTPFYDKSNKPPRLPMNKLPEDSSFHYDYVDTPPHYVKYPIEVIDMMIRIWGESAAAQYCEMNAFKYRMRAGTKPGNSLEQDLAKEKWYLDKALELRQSQK